MSKLTERIDALRSPEGLPEEMTYGRLMMICEGHGTSQIYEHIKTLRVHAEQAESALAALQARLSAVEKSACRHGWRGTVPENGQQIATPCPACGARSLFIGSGGHLTCARVPSDYSDGCHSPSVEATITALKNRAEQAESAIALKRKEPT